MEDIEVCYKNTSTGENVNLFWDEVPSSSLDEEDDLPCSGQEHRGAENQRGHSTILPDLLRDTESHDECMRRVVPKVRPLAPTPKHKHGGEGCYFIMIGMFEIYQFAKMSGNEMSVW
uniref:Uncharacterized protein n=1 Tax=Magallana gigas TaxID=29159 RepID=A0A8W8ID33_MAGGI